MIANNGFELDPPGLDDLDSVKMETRKMWRPERVLAFGFADWKAGAGRRTYRKMNRASYGETLV